ncbi:hypothetical protein DFH06DRAFT_1135063 [Mycena polygramma]|nr:hypothetical protein DFH06DRAFT_1135063 [Mycena polygramma]
MHFVPCLVAFIVAVATSTYAKCYNSGEKWDPLFAEQDVRDAARFFGGGAAGKSWPHGKEVEHTVYHGNSSGCVKFKLQNVTPFDRTIYEAEAYAGFSNEYTGCERGGDRSYDNWRFVAKRMLERITVTASVFGDSHSGWILRAIVVGYRYNSFQLEDV